MAGKKKDEFAEGEHYETSQGEVEVVGVAEGQEGYVCQHCGYEGEPNLVRAIVEPPTSIACPDCGKTEHER